MRVLVTGGAGFIGRHVVQRLLESGREGTVLDDLSVGSAEAVPGARLWVGEVTDPVAVADAMDGAEAVVHLAARVSIRRSVEGLADDFHTNLAGTLAVLGALEGSAVRRFVFASSMAVYAESEDGAPVAETHRLEPRSPYGVSKLAAEHYVRLVCEGLGIERCVLRYFNTWGPGQTPTPYVGLVTITIRRLLDGSAPVIFGDGEQRRDFVHVDDVAAATVLALDHPATAGETLNVGTGHGRSVNEVVERLRTLVPGAQPPRHEPARPEELRHSVADVARIERVLGWRAVRTGLDFEDLVEVARASG